MKETTYLPEVECTIAIPNGIVNMQLVAVPDETGRCHYLHLGQGNLTEDEGKTYLPIGVIDLDNRGQRALVELPMEAGSGTRRIWVPYKRFRPQRAAS